MTEKQIIKKLPYMFCPKCDKPLCNNSSDELIQLNFDRGYGGVCWQNDDGQIFFNEGWENHLHLLCPQCNDIILYETTESEANDFIAKAQFDFNELQDIINKELEDDDFSKTVEVYNNMFPKCRVGY